MVENEVATIENVEQDGPVARIYEIGYHISPSVKEEDIEKTVSEIRSEIEKQGGSFIAEGAPSMARFSYNIEAKEHGKKVQHDRGYFGWLKFEVTIDGAKTVEEALKQNGQILRFIMFRTVREDTRAKMKAPQLREVKRTDVIKTTARRTEEASAPVSEEDLEKALQDITE